MAAKIILNLMADADANDGRRITVCCSIEGDVDWLPMAEEDVARMPKRVKPDVLKHVQVYYDRSSFVWYSSPSGPVTRDTGSAEKHP